MHYANRAAFVALSLFSLHVGFHSRNPCCYASEPDRPVWQSGFVGTPDPAPPLTLQRAFPKIGFKNPISINRLPESDRLLVLEQHHKIYSFRAKEDVEQAELMVDFSKDQPLCGNLPERDKRNISLFSIAFHPKYAENRFAYICYTSTLGTEKLHISRFTVDRNEIPGLVTGSEVEILTCDGGGHQGCTLLFDKAGYLYISIGDLTEPSPPDRLETGQDISDLYASILRIDVDHPEKGRNYSIPNDNPFINLKWARPEVYAFGFRNPFRMTFDPPTGDLWVGDVGWEAWEMVYRVKSGGNYGWAIKEGPGDVKAQKPGPAPIEPPQIALGHNEAASVTGGFVYHGKQFPEFAGKYIFGDWTSRKFWAATFDAQRVTALKEIAATKVKPICFEVDSQGELLVLDYIETDSGIYRFHRNPIADKPTDQFPRKLSQTRLFTDIAARKPSAGVTSFRLNAPMWMDGAQPEYLLAIPSKENVTFYQQPQKMFDWLNTTVRPPNGSVIAKTYTIALDHKDPANVKPIETQIAAKDDQGEWQYYTYRWNENGTDADLVDSAGAHRMLEIEESTGKRKLDWQFASRSQCRTCHTPWVGETLGFIEPQLRSPHQPTDSWRELFAGKWAAAEASQLPLDDGHYLGLVNPMDASQPLDKRARAYLHSNCAHCHLNGGNASTVFELQFTKPLHEAKMLSTKPMRGDFGIKDAKIVAAGSPNQSVLLYRMSKAGTGHMPHIGSQLADGPGIQLLRQWIATLPSNDEHLKLLETLCGPVLKRDDEQRLKAANDLMSTLAGTMELSAALADGRVPSWLIRPIIEAGMKLEDAAKRDLIEPYATGDLQVARLGANVVPSELLAIKGDRTAGEKLFASGVGQCSQCHRIANVGKEVGPDLSRIMDKLKSREKILHSILDPSAEIDEKYKSTALVTVDGQTFVGRVVSRDEQHIVLQDAQGKSEKLAVVDVEQEKTLSVSLMPQQLLGAFSAQQAADLLAFLEALK
jgi:putative heme-binding domain-containing protein